MIIIFIIIIKFNINFNLWLVINVSYMFKLGLPYKSDFTSFDKLINFIDFVKHFILYLYYYPNLKIFSGLINALIFGKNVDSNYLYKKTLIFQKN